MPHRLICGVFYPKRIWDRGINIQEKIKALTLKVFGFFLQSAHHRALRHIMAAANAMPHRLIVGGHSHPKNATAQHHGGSPG